MILCLKFYFAGLVLWTFSVAKATELACGEDRPADVDASLPGVLSSPDWGSTYPPNSLCEWRLTTTENSIELKFAELQIEECGIDCKCDGIEVYDGPEADEEDLIGVYCGSSLPSSIISTGNAMFIRFYSDESTEANGFLARYGPPYDEEWCNGIAVLEEDNGYLFTPNWPDDYPNFAECHWVLQAPEGMNVQVEFLQFDLEDCCICDYVSVYDGNDMLEDPQIGRWNGRNTSPPIMTSSGNAFYIKYQSDYSHFYGGFVLRYRHA